jgi:glucose-1-phosphate thymidylyltransferase
MKAVILAAGKGSRLYPITHHIPKPLLPLGNRPTIEYAFERLAEIGVREICIVVGENGAALREALGSEYRDQRLSYVLQDVPKGLAHALTCARDFVADEPFVMYLGDGIYSDTLLPFVNRFNESGCANLNLVQEVDEPERFGIANVEGERIVRLVEKPAEPESNLAMAGVYFFDERIWGVMPRLRPSARGEYEITDAIQLLIEDRETVLAGVYRGRWFDTGTLDSFLACSDFLIGGGARIAAGAVVRGSLGASVCVGEGAMVNCSHIEDCVVLPGSRVECAGAIRHSILGGFLSHEGSIEGEILYGNEPVK